MRWGHTLFSGAQGKGQQEQPGAQEIAPEYEENLLHVLLYIEGGRALEQAAPSGPGVSLRTHSKPTMDTFLCKLL